jgi:hypothetical protein
MKRVLRQDRPQGAGRGCKADKSATTTHRPQGERLAAYPLRVLAPLLLVVALVAIAVAGYWLKRPPEALTVSCADLIAGCDIPGHHGAAAHVQFSMQPAPMEPFELRVTASGTSRVSAEFQMVGMDMGFNRYDLHPTTDGAFASKVTLPVCVSGRRDWVLYLDVDGSRYALPFGTR